MGRLNIILVFVSLLWPATALVMAPQVQAQVKQEVSAASLAGSYDVRGRNPNGSAYSGALEIAVIDNVPNFTWNVGNRIYKGQGSFVGNVLVVNWGNSAPVIYTIDLDGNLSGTWSNGQASERLTRK